MTLLDVIDLDKIWTVNSMWQKKFFEPWAKVGAALGLKLWKKEKKRKWLNMMNPSFLYSNFY